MDYEYHLLDVFSEVPFGGNQLAVFPDAASYDEDLMQRLARELALSESVFVLPAIGARAACRLRIFTPRMELPFAGHPTLGAAQLLLRLGVISLDDGAARFVVEEAVGDVPIVARRRSDGTLFTQLEVTAPPEHRPAPDRRHLARMLGLGEADLASGPAECVSAGVPFLLVPVAGTEALGRVRLAHDAWSEILAGTWAPHVVAYCPEEEVGLADVRLRMFSPEMGIPEDPATGAAAAALGALLGRRDPTRDGLLRWVFAQGVEMGRPSRLDVEVEKSGGRVVALRVGGTAVYMGRGRIVADNARLSGPEEAIRLAESFLDRVWGSAHDLDAIDELTTEDYRLTTAGLEIRGREAFKDWVRGFQERLGDARTTSVDTFADRDAERVVSRWTCSGTNRGLFDLPADGREVEFSGIAIWRVREGRLAECWVERAGLEVFLALKT